MTLPFDLPEHVRRHGAGLRQLALELLGDAAAAEDAVQQVWLAAVQSPPRHQEAVGGWLARMLRNVAVDWRRAARRRTRREQVAATAKAPVGEDPAETTARVDAARRLLTAVESLAEPYRGAIWQRFFDELPPRAIAAARGVPVATVKSWLLRGLELLRERLVRTDGADWRMAFAAAFRLGERSARAGAVGAGVLGGAIVATWMKLSLAAAVALAAVFCWPSGAATADGAGSSAHGVPPLAAAADAPTALREPAPSAPAANPIAAATIRGRCVDRHGASLAGCVAQLTGWSASDERLEAWLRDHEPPQWLDPAPITTSDDGVFAIHFAPPVPFRFSLQVHSERHGAIAARWPQLEPTATVDLGDVEMGVGARLAGRVVDGAGLPVAGTLVVVNRVDRRRGAPAPARDRDFDPASGSARSNECGQFVLPAPLLPGDYAVESKGPSQREPLVVHLEEGRDQRNLVVLVDRSEQTTIRGRVVDETGMPVADARVMGEPRPNGRFWTTDREGAFDLRIPCAEAASPVDVVAESPRHEARAIAKAVAWGRSDVVLTLRNAARLELRVRDAERPVEQFTVRLLSRDYPSSNDSRVRARGPFAGGVAVLPGVRKGRWIAVLEFPTSAGLATAVVPFAVDAAPLARLEVTAHRIGERTAVVVDETDRPVAGARIVLCHAVDAALDENTLLVTPETYPHSQGRAKAIIASEATTDDAGRATLQGPIGERMAVALPGGAHVPAFVRDVRLDDAAPFSIAVERGARLRARVRTADELDALLRLCGITDSTIGAARRPTLLLSADGRTVPDLVAVMARETGGRGAMSDSGWFEFGGLRREHFAMTLLYWPPGGGVEELSVGGVDLASVSEREVALDLSALVLGTLRGSLTVNGKPVALRAMRFEGPGKQEIETDGSGRFEATLRGGVYRVFAAMSGSSHAFVPVAEGVTVRAKDDTALPIDVQTGRLRLRLVRGEAPQSKRIALYATLATSAEPVRLPRLDADDVLEVELPVGTIRIAAAVDDMLARRAARDAVHLDTVTIAAGATTAVELRLPPGLGR